MRKQWLACLLPLLLAVLLGAAPDLSDPLLRQVVWSPGASVQLDSLELSCSAFRHRGSGCLAYITVHNNGRQIEDLGALQIRWRAGTERGEADLEIFGSPVLQPGRCLQGRVWIPSRRPLAARRPDLTLFLSRFPSQFPQK